MENLYLINVYPETIADGFGIRYSIYLSGCHHHCPGCHNPESWSQHTGSPLTEEILSQIIRDINNNPLLDGITLSGGDPFFNPGALFGLLKRLKSETKQNIWCYTGYTLEEITKDERLSSCLQFIDTLVDGRFDKNLYDPSLAFRGSSNQKIINLHKKNGM